MLRRCKSNAVSMDVGDDAGKLAAELQPPRLQQFLDSSLPKGSYEQRKLAQAKRSHNNCIEQDQPANQHPNVDGGHVPTRPNCNFAKDCLSDVHFPSFASLCNIADYREPNVSLIKGQTPSNIGLKRGIGKLDGPSVDCGQVTGETGN